MHSTRASPALALSCGAFAEAGAVPVLMNVVFIIAMMLAHYYGWDIGLTLAWTTPITGIAQLAWTLYAARRIGLESGAVVVMDCHSGDLLAYDPVTDAFGPLPF